MSGHPPRRVRTFDGGARFYLYETVAVPPAADGVQGDWAACLVSTGLILFGPKTDDATWPAGAVPLAVADLAAKIDKATLDANSVLYATADDTPAALALGASTILARLAAGNIVAATPAQIKTLLAVAEADVTGLVADLAARALAAGEVTKAKTADESVTSSSVAQADDELFFAVAANEVWVVDFSLLVDGATTGDLRTTVTGPAGSSGTFTTFGMATSATVAAGAVLQQSAALGTNIQNGMVGAGTTLALPVHAVVRNGAAAGTVTLTWGQSVSDPTATRALANSSMVARRVGG